MSLFAAAALLAAAALVGILGFAQGPDQSTCAYLAHNFGSHCAGYPAAYGWAAALLLLGAILVFVLPRWKNTQGRRHP